ncbi:conserved hypothetical protein [Photorhabdus asymbiotica]|uniref:Uncharacterized protein n=1 Tax=Photorhabdus asymbiotica subsp. asymbiotica (strain ATCC 43949 / 3105-77) TaxID=553480 RepID=B6VMI3_PHOAA|nr:conserved hypothetical protein [Photorhabdus asymbiotica]CAR67363.1 Hypothetical Protein PA-RVA13-1234 [Photorhabdus asymbiotica subsp. asymbiotica ATCC 43949]
MADSDNISINYKYKWSYKMKYDPRLRTFVEDDYRYEDHLNFKKQIYPIDFKLQRGGK